MSRKIWLGLAGLACTVVLAAIASLAIPKDRAPAVKRLQLVQTLNHDEGAFCQGLVVDNGEMWEGTGKYGESTLRKVDLQTGKVLASVPLAKEVFGEGITLLDGKIYQLTWRENVCLVYDQATLKYTESLRYSGEGWGLANDGKYLYLSDGTANIRVIDPVKFNVVRRIGVHMGTRRIDQLNELEFVNGEIWANIWYSDQIARISPKSGEVIGWLDASHLWPASQRPTKEHVLNGIAFDKATKKIYLTGKNWPKLFEVSLPE